MSNIQVNKKAYRDYEIIEKIDAGIKLQGQEVKSLREGKGSLKGTYVKIFDNEAFLIGFHLPPYSKSGQEQFYDPDRSRKLLLKKSQIRSLKDSVKQKGLTVVPLKIYSENKFIKLLIGLARGKQVHQKKQDLINKQIELETKRAEKQRYR